MTWSVRWRRLDLPGTDEAYLESTAAGHRLSGMCRFKDHDGPVALDYVVDLADNWVTRTAIVTGTTPPSSALPLPGVTVRAVYLGRHTSDAVHAS